MLAVDFPPFEIILFIVAAVIAVGNRLIEAGRKVRRRSLEQQERHSDEQGVQLREEGMQLREDGVQLREPGEKRPARVPPHRQPAAYSLPPSPPAPVQTLPRLSLGGPHPQPSPELWGMARPMPGPATPARHASTRRAREVAAMLRDPRRIQDAIVLREILGPPRAMQRWRR